MGDADGAGIPDVAVNNLMMRDDWIKRQMAKRISEFTDEKTLHVFLGTWNVNAKKENCRLEAWLRPPQMTVSPDIYAIGMQEIVDLNASNVMRDPQTAEPWIQKFQSCLSDNYLLVNYKQLVGIVLCVFAKKDIYPAHMSQVLMAQTGVGVMGIGNKGAIAISFNLYDSSICVVNSHLAAHQNNAQARNDNFRDINEKLRFSPGAERGQRADSFAIDRHDYVFWIGDLNYRIDLPDMDVIYERIAANDLSYLLRYDQLMVERANAAVFQRYSEGSITFLPTYKFQPNTNEYERRPDKKKRAPAWCDRILWKTQSGNAQQLFYQSAPSLLMSDHKPVMSCFAIAVKVLVQERRNEVFQSLVKQLDALENQQIPKIALSSTSVHFPAVHFDQRQSQTIQLRNDGEAIVQFHFAPKPDAATKREICKPWLSIEPAFGIIPPGETLDIAIQIHVVSRDIAFGLNIRQLVLDDILIMKLFKGCDYFIPVSGDWLPSCAASTIEYLVCVSGPVRTQSSVQPSAGDNVLAIPKELWRIVDYLYRNGGLSTPELFTSCGNNDDVPNIFDDLDTNTAFRKQYAPISMAEVLVRFLDSLSKPVIPIQLCQEFRQSPDPTAFCKQCLIDLPLAHYNVVIYIVSFLRELLTRQEQNEIQPRDLALVFGQALTQFPPRSSSSTDSPGADLMMHLLTSPAFE